MLLSYKKEEEKKKTELANKAFCQFRSSMSFPSERE